MYSHHSVCLIARAKCACVLEDDVFVLLYLGLSTLFIRIFVVVVFESLPIVSPIADLSSPHWLPFFLYTSLGQSPLSPVQCSGISHSLRLSRQTAPRSRSYSAKTQSRKINKRFILKKRAQKCQQFSDKKLTLQLSQHIPVAHCASDFSLHVILSQHGSVKHSSLVPQSHSSSSSTILLPQFRRSIEST